jgi:proteasome lid subunit RPN8/RPN11
VRIRRETLDAIAVHARDESPRECCGLLIGTDVEAIEAVAAANVAAEPHRHYQVSPVDHFALIKRCRDAAAPGVAAVNVIGAYHSHPRSAPVPSPTDLAEAFGEFLYIIAGRVDGAARFEFRAYRLLTGRFEDVPLTVAERH